MKIIDVVIEEEKVQVKDTTSKRDSKTEVEEDVESKNQAMLERDTHVLIMNDLSLEKNILEVLISNSTEQVLMEPTLNSPQGELQEEIAIEDLSMVFHPIETKFAKAYTTPPGKQQQFSQRDGWRGSKKKPIYEELLERVQTEKLVIKWQAKKHRSAHMKTSRRSTKTRGRVFFQLRGNDVLQIAAQHIKALHEQVKKQIEKKNAAYAQGTIKGKKQVHFNPSDLVWIYLRMERFPSKRKSKLMPRAEGPFRVKEKVNDNAYKIELLDDYNVLATFNVRDLFPYFEDEEDLDLRANPSKPGGDDVPKNAVQDEAKSSLGPITRSKAKKLAATSPRPITILKCVEI
ncbi:hypothetical protein CRG98_011370 [Punica granatum]|uniref:Tf2-1-like SH3-like domain-containing protein n=1 Tax=Punica granatum TaxID=22663 RepID=A0A2I0KI83_PUNGR|nr:hypothetical protein CRG98_011370 [Punica granatum]